MAMTGYAEQTLTVRVRTVRAFAVALLGLLAMIASLWRWDPPVVRVSEVEVPVSQDQRPAEVNQE
ncbi:MAG: hypothetical protein AAGA65_17960 [Actinomycetota bacterium]